MSDYIWDSLWLNANLACMNSLGPKDIIHNGAIACKDGLISWLGPQIDLHNGPEKLAKEVVDVKNNWLLPGFIDCHTHLIYAGSRAKEWSERLSGVSYEEISRRGGGILSTVESTRAASEEDLFAASEPRLQAMIREGLTTIEIKSGYGLDLATELAMLKVARDLGKKYGVTVRTTLLAAHAVPKEYLGCADKYMDLICEEILPEAHRLGLMDAVDAFCENIAFSVAQIERLFQHAKELGLPVKIHAEQLSNQQGAMLASRYHALSADHLDYLSDEGVKAMAKAGMVAVLLPGTSYFLQATQNPPIARLREQKVPMAIATNMNPGSSPIGSLLLILNMACTLYKLTPHEALMGMTNHAAMALGIAEKFGTLSVGKSADFVEWQISDPVELCYQIGMNPCRRVVKAGVIVHRSEEMCS